MPLSGPTELRKLTPLPPVPHATTLRPFLRQAPSFSRQLSNLQRWCASKFDSVGGNSRRGAASFSRSHAAESSDSFVQNGEVSCPLLIDFASIKMYWSFPEQTPES